MSADIRGVHDRLSSAGSLPLIVIGLASVFGAGLLTLASEKRS